MTDIQNVRVTAKCPNCGAPDYEIDFEPGDLNAEISFPCDECPKRIAVSIDVMLQSFEVSR